MCMIPLFTSIIYQPEHRDHFTGFAQIQRYMCDGNPIESNYDLYTFAPTQVKCGNQSRQKERGYAENNRLNTKGDKMGILKCHVIMLSGDRVVIL